MNTWCVEVWGNFACFTRPEMKVERVSYDVITPSAARAIYEAILWKPEIKWNITKIEVMNPVKWFTIKRNEVSKKISLNQKIGQGNGDRDIGLVADSDMNRVQRTSLILKDVRYRLHAYFDYLGDRSTGNLRNNMNNLSEEEVNSLSAKYASMFERRIKKGQCFHRPYLGNREFACEFKLVEKADDSKPIQENRDLGIMLYDIEYQSNGGSVRPYFFRATMEKGVIEVDKRKVVILR